MHVETIDVKKSKYPDFVFLKRKVAKWVYHSHDFYEFDLVLSGSATTNVDGTELTVGANDVMIIPPGVEHKYYDIDKLFIYKFQFKPSFISQETLEKLQKSDKIHFSLYNFIYNNLFKLAEIIEYVSNGGSDNRRLLSMLIDSAVLMTLSNSPREETNTSVPFGSMLRVVEYLSNNYKSNPSLSDAAEIAHFNERYFCLKFREYTGKSYKDFLTEIKMTNAKRLIESTELSINEVATESGYSTQSHFNREFKKYYGLSPLQMRKIALANSNIFF